MASRRGTRPSRSLSIEAAVHFRGRLRAARDLALADSEGFMQLIQEIEQLGSFLTNDPDARTFARHEDSLVLLAQSSLTLEPNFELLLAALRKARNDAAHLGAAARRTTSQAVSVALVLEEAMAGSTNLRLVEHYMVDTPVSAESWQTIAMVRRVMLHHQFSVLPYRHGKTWKLLTDGAVVRFLGDERERRQARLASTIAEALPDGLSLVSARTARLGTPVHEAYDPEHAPTLIVLDSSDNLRGILTPFDML